MRIEMNACVAAALVVAAGLLMMLIGCSAPEPTGYGSCYEPKPICMYPTVPVCLCDWSDYCVWACVQP